MLMFQKFLWIPKAMDDGTKKHTEKKLPKEYH